MKEKSQPVDQLDKEIENYYFQISVVRSFEIEDLRD